MQRYKPIPLVQAGGHQPYALAGGQMPGAALSAMLGGSTLYGANPMDAQRLAQKGAKKRPVSLLDMLAR